MNPCVDEDPTSDLDNDAPAPPLSVDTQLARGALLGGRYLLESCVGIGGTAVIWRVRDVNNDGTSVALKVLRPEFRRDPAAIGALKREFQLARSLVHPNIARVFDLDREDDLWFLAIELLDGEPLAALLKRQGTKPMPAQRTREILQACGEALAFAHRRGIVHGDFKPANIVLTPSGRICLLDFGAASGSTVPVAAHTRTVTLAYASPEVLSGARPEPRDDVFSFACVAYELLTGQHPFARASALEARDNGRDPPRAWHLTDRQWYPLEAALAWHRESRPHETRALLAALPRTETPAPLDIPPISLPPIDSNPPNVASLRAALAVGGFAVVLAIAFFQLKTVPDDLFPPATALHAAPQLMAAASAPAAPPREAPFATIRATPAPPAPVPTPATAVTTTRTPTAAAPPASISFNESAITVHEQAVAAVLMLRRSGALSTIATVKWRVVPGSASAGLNLAQPTAGTAGFSAGQSSRVIYIPLTNDRIAEPDKSFVVGLHDPSRNARLGAPARIQVTIQDDDR